MNLSEKIIKQHLVMGEMRKGWEIALRVDQTLTQDALGTISYMAFEKMNIPKVKTDLSVSYLDHNMLYVDNKNPDDHAYLISIAQKYGILLSRAGNGICHQIHCGRFAVPGGVLLGTDSHTPSCGAVGMLGIGAGGTDVAAAMAGYPFHFNMPEIIRVWLTGKLPAGVTSKDLALELLSRLTVGGGCNKILEYNGPGVETLNVPQRLTVANMGTETGATSSIFPSDLQVLRFLRAQKREKEFLPLVADDDAYYTDTIEINMDNLVPLVAKPSQPDNVVPVDTLGEVRVDQVFIGSCTNSSYSDFKKAAIILKDKLVPPHVSLVVAPGSRQIYKMLLRDGIMEIFLSSGARILECCCGPCVGMGQAVKTQGVSLRTSNRNFTGRAGTVDAGVYIASPEVAAATAVRGFICSPGEVVDIDKLKDIDEPEEYWVDDGMFVKPPPTGDCVTIVRGPNIRSIPDNTPLPDIIEAKVVVKVGDNVSTDEIAPTGAAIGALRSNIPLAAKTVFSRVDPDFIKRIETCKNSIIIAGGNYGQGSSREHAALLPMYLGVKAVIAKSFARIHRQNLINFGILPLEFEKEEAYDEIAQNDVLFIKQVRTQVSVNRIVVRSLTRNRDIETLCRLTEREKDIVLAGGLLNIVRETNRLNS